MQLTEIPDDLERPLPARAEASPQPSPPSVDEAGVAHQDDDGDTEERGLDALNPPPPMPYDTNSPLTQILQTKN